MKSPNTNLKSRIAALTLVALLANTVGADGKDLAYGSLPQQKLDVYSARGDATVGGRPVVVWVHGGGWQNGDKDNRAGTHLCKAWADTGVVMVNLNYRLTPDVMHPARVEDVAAGIAWTHANIAEYGGDPNQIFLLGHSAGAHLVALVATNPAFLARHRLVPNAVLKGVMPIDTASYDLTESQNPIARKLIHDAFGDNPKTLTEASPLVQAKEHRDTCPAFLIAVVKQRPDALRESNSLKEVLTDSKLIVMDYSRSGQRNAHGEIARDLSDVDNKMTKQLLAFVKSGKL